MNIHGFYKDYTKLPQNDILEVFCSTPDEEDQLQIDQPIEEARVAMYQYQCYLLYRVLHCT